MKKILVIDDDDLIRGMICNVLKKSGFSVIEASNGVRGVEKAKIEKPLLIITDILMPDKEGIETILELKTVDPNVKIIAMSGGGSSKNMTFLEMAQKVGAQKVLSKPFRPNELLSTVQSILSS